MADTNLMTPAELKLAIHQSGSNAMALSEHIGRGKDYIRDYLVGRKDGLSAKEWEQIALFLKSLPESQPKARAAGNYRPPPQMLGKADLPVFAAVEGGPGVMVVTTEPIDFVNRPLPLQHVRDGYAVLVVGDSMEPVFEPGDMVLVHPKMPAIRGRNAIFVAGEGQGEFRATVKRLLGETADKWKVRQYNPAKEFTLPKEEWPKALRIIGKLDGG